MKLAEAWLGGPSSIFWETAVILILTIVLVFIGFLTLRTAAARKSLNCSIISRTRLLDAPESMRGKLQVIFGNEPPLSDPYVTVVEIANTGKTPIASKLFDERRSMIFNLGADIIEVLSVERTPESSPLPTINSSGSAIKIHPELITAGEVIRVSVLTRGRVQNIELTLNPLTESFKIFMRDREVWQRQQHRKLKYTRFALVVLLVVEVIGILLLANHALNNTTSALNTQISLAKNGACNGVEEAALNLSSTATDDVEHILAMLNGDSNRLIKFNDNFTDDVTYFNLQISDFSSNKTVAASLGINMKDSNLTVQEANRFLAEYKKLPKSRTFPEQHADLLQAEASSLSILKGFGGVIHECRPYVA